MQLYWLSPIIILPLWINWKYGIAIWAMVFSIITGVIGWVTKACTKAPTSVMASAHFIGHELEHRPPACDKQFRSIDYGPMIHGQPYLIGLLFGWILYKTKGKKIKIPHVRDLST